MTCDQMDQCWAQIITPAGQSAGAGTACTAQYGPVSMFMSILPRIIMPNQFGQFKVSKIHFKVLFRKIYKYL